LCDSFGSVSLLCFLVDEIATDKAEAQAEEANQHNNTESTCNEHNTKDENDEDSQEWAPAWAQSEAATRSTADQAVQ